MMAFFRLLLFLVILIGATEANTSIYFRKAPQSVDVLVGTSVTFECQAAWAAGVRWEVNDRGWDIFVPPPFDLRISPDVTWNSSIYSRTLTAEREYNNTAVRCVLSLNPGGQKIYSDAALIIVRDFSQVPESINTTLGSVVNFSCVPYYPYHNVSWYINGAELSQLNPPPVVSLVSGATIQIMAQQQFNNTAVHCRIHNTAITSPAALLRIQGELGAVGDLHVAVYDPNSLLISWTAPFSLDITDSHPDLWFSLSILTPATGSLLPCTDCGHITDTSYNLSASGLTQGGYEIQVVAANDYGTSNQPEKVSLYVRMVANTQEEHLYSDNIHLNATQLCGALDQSQLAVTPTSCPSLSLSGIGLGVVVGVLLVAIPAGLVVITCYTSSRFKTHLCRGRKELQTAELHQNPAYETWSPKESPTEQGACTAVLLSVTKTERELKVGNAYTPTKISTSQGDKVYEEIPYQLK